MTDIKRWRGLKTLLTDAVEQGATAIERVHKKSSERPFEILKAVAPLEEPVREIQAELQREGYDVGPLDGRLGPRTKAAIREYEQRNGLPVDGSPSRSLREHMRSHPTG